MPDNESQSLKALKKGAAKEISRADRLHDLEKSKRRQKHDLSVMDRKNSDKEHYRNTWLFGSIAMAILVLLATTLFIPIFCKTCKDNTLAISSFIFLLGNLMGYLFGRRK